MKYTLACGMPNLTKLESVVGNSTRSWKTPRSCGPRARAVMTLVTIPSAVTITCAPKNPSESRTNRLLRASAIGRSHRRERRRRAERIERVAVLAHDQLAVLGRELAPQPSDRRLERIAGLVESRHVDRHVRDTELLPDPRQLLGRTHLAVVDQPLLEV